MLVPYPFARDVTREFVKTQCDSEAFFACHLTISLNLQF
jgi:hypothetical protein